MIAAPIRLAAERITPSSSSRLAGVMPMRSVPSSSRSATCPMRRGSRASGASCVKA